MSRTIKMDTISFRQLQKRTMEMINAAASSSDLFGSKLMMLRHKIKVYCEGKLLTTATTSTSELKDLEKNLWRFGFYLTIDKSRKIRRKARQAVGGWSSQAEGLVQQFLNEAFGFYHTLSLKLWPQLVDLDEFTASSEIMFVNHGSVPRELLHSVLVHLGDIARYQFLFEDLQDDYKSSCRPSARDRASALYYAAFHLLPDDGTPFNQLAVLHSGDSLLFSSVYFYMRSVASHNPGAGSSQNILMLLQKSKKNWSSYSVADIYDFGNAKAAYDELSQLYQSVFERLLQLNGLLYMEHNLNGFETLCELVLNRLKWYIFGSWYCETVEAAPHGHKSPKFDANQALQIITSVIFSCWNKLRLGASTGGFIECSEYFSMKIIASYAVWVAQRVQTSVRTDDFSDLLTPITVSLRWILSATMSKRIAKKKSSSHNKLMLAVCILLNAIIDFADEAEIVLGDCDDVLCLPEDVLLYGFGPLHETQNLLNSTLKDPDMDISDVRCSIILKLGKKIASAGIILSYSEKRNRFMVQDEVVEVEECDKVPEDALRSGNEGQNKVKKIDGKEEMMKKMARARLKTEIDTLESELGSTRSSRPDDTAPPLLIVDTNSLVSSLSLIKQLATSGDFILVIPLAVIGALDDLKKGTGRVNRGAREAIRLLEHFFSEGNPHIRAQKREETSQIVEANSSSEDVRIISCASYFGQHICLRMDLVTVLTESKPLRHLAESVGLNAMPLKSFVSLFRGEEPKIKNSRRPVK